ncbi:MAG: hypothetical protein PF444_02715 [Bacteroidales bacterium]|nr:hypothetical protein [Bacteroidales bacterium]
MFNMFGELAHCVSNLRFEYLTNPVGVDVLFPHFSWEITSQKRGVIQSAYEINVSPGDYAI